MVKDNDNDEKIELSTKAQFAKLVIGTAAAFIATKVVESGFDALAKRHQDKATDTDQ